MGFGDSAQKALEKAVEKAAEAVTEVIRVRAMIDNVASKFIEHERRVEQRIQDQDARIRELEKSLASLHGKVDSIPNRALAVILEEGLRQRALPAPKDGNGSSE